MDSLDADEILVAWAYAVCTVTYIARNSGIIIEFHLIHGIGNVDRVVLIVYGRTLSSLRLRLPLWLDGQYLPGVIPLSLGRLLTGIPAILDLCGGSRRVKAYQDLPLNHPNLHLPYQATDDDDRGG